MYFNGYNKLLNEYIRDIDIDIASNLTPPKELKQEIAVIQSVGDVQTSNGPMNFQRNTRQFVNVNDVETLIRNGQVVKTNNKD